MFKLMMCFGKERDTGDGQPSSQALALKDKNAHFGFPGVSQPPPDRSVDLEAITLHG